MSRRSSSIVAGPLAIALALSSALWIDGFVEPAWSVAAQGSAAAQQTQFGVKVALKGSWLEAAFRFEKAIKLGDASARTYNNLAVARESLGQFDQARAAYETALARQGDADDERRIRENYNRFLDFLKMNRPGDATP